MERYLKLLDIHKGLAMCQPRRFNSLFFYKGLWNDHLLQLQYPQLFSFVKATDITLEQTLLEELQDLFKLPLSDYLSKHFSNLMLLRTCCKIINQLQRRTCWLIINSEDQLTYIWNNATFCSVKAYKIFVGHIQTPPFFQWLWKCSCQSKHKVFKRGIILVCFVGRGWRNPSS